MVNNEAKIRQTLSPPFFEPKTFIATKLKGMKDIEKTKEHIDIIKLSTLNKLAVKEVIGMKAT